MRGLEQTEDKRMKVLNMQISLNGIKQEIKCVDPVLNLLPDFHLISKNGRNIYEYKQFNQYVLETDFHITFSNGRDQ